MKSEMTRREFLKKSGKTGLVVTLLSNGIGLKEVFANNNSIRQYDRDVKYFYPYLSYLMINYGINFEGTDNPNDFPSVRTAKTLFKINDIKIISGNCKIYAGGDMPENIKADAIRNEVVHEILETDKVQKQLDRGENIDTIKSHRDAIREHLEQYGEWLTPIEYLRWALSYVRNGDGKEFPESPICVNERGKVETGSIRWTEQVPKENSSLIL